MCYKTKIKTRIAAAFLWIMLGAAIMLINGIYKNDKSFGFGLCFTVVGIMQAVRYVRLFRNASEMQKREITENDERNVMLVEKARGLTYTISIFCAGIAVIVFSILENSAAVQILTAVICLMVFVDYICYYILKKIF